MIIKTELLERQFKNEILSHGIVMKDDFDFETHKRLVYWGIRNHARKKQRPQSLEAATIRFHSFLSILDLIEMITPRQLMLLFPIEKEFDGARYGVKDYFYTVTVCRKHGFDNQIKDAFEFLWDYQNWEVSRFIIGFMSAISDMRRLEGRAGLIEEFAAMNGFKTYQMREMNGSTVLVENLVITDDGKVL